MPLLVVVSASGGARMQEGTLALMQLAKTMAALERLRGRRRAVHLSVLSDPTTGGVFASFAAVGDVNIAEPNALIGFAGARVTAGTIAAELPAGFQRSEFLFEPRLRRPGRRTRAELRDELAGLLRLLPAARRPRRRRRRRATDVPASGRCRSCRPRRPDAGEPAADRRRRTRAASRAIASDAPVARPTRRPTDGARRADRSAGRRPPTPTSATPRATRSGRASSWPATSAGRGRSSSSRAMADDFVELHGDRLFGDDEAMVAGLARLDGRRVVVIGQQKGADTDENIRRNFGMPHPEGYRKAMRVMELAERFGLPVVTFVDVPGAHPGPESEERGIAEAIARSIGLMSRLRTPIVTVITGEGGSGGALAIAVGDVVIALENAVYSVISPEGCASILWRTADEAPTAAAAMRMTAADQHALGVVDIVVAGARRGRPRRPRRDRPPAQGDHRRPARPRSTALPLDELVEARYRRYRALGAYTEVAAAGRARTPSTAASRIASATCSIRAAGGRRRHRGLVARRAAGPRGGLAACPTTAPAGCRRRDRTRRRARRRPRRDRPPRPTSCCRPSSPSSARPASASSRSARAAGGSGCADPARRPRPAATDGRRGQPARRPRPRAGARPRDASARERGADRSRRDAAATAVGRTGRDSAATGARGATARRPVATSPAVGIYQPARRRARRARASAAGDRLGAVDMLGVAQEVVAPGRRHRRREPRRVGRRRRVRPGARRHRVRRPHGTAGPAPAAVEA